ncbi:MAG: site-2 protease family protein [Clostridia bacterium]|nr:site-2 protease family protein [Clostridia bacterium]
MYYILAILIFGILIFVHEAGHYTAARIFHVTINEFSIGMGPKLISKKSGKTGISYSLRLLPIGGFVSMAGEDDECEDENALFNKPAWQRFIIMIAGSFMNLVAGFIVTLILVLSVGHVYGTTVTGFAEGALSGTTGLKEGDRIVSVEGHATGTLYDLSYDLMRYAGEDTTLTVIRNGQKTVITGVSFPVYEDGYALRDFNVNEEKFGFLGVIKQTAIRSVTMIRIVYDSLYDLITGKYGIKDMSGPVGVTKVIGDAAAANDGGQTLFYLVSLIAVNLGIFNLLPFPALDGFRALLIVIEKISGKRINKKIEGYINFAGLALLMILMVVVTFSDVSSLFGKS